MSRLTTPAESQLNTDTLAALEPVRVKGQLAPIYLQFANSQVAIRAYLQMEKALQQGSLDTREIEAIKLWVSEHTACDYCLSVHTFKASQAKLGSEQQLAIRQGKACGDRRIDGLIMLATHLVRQPGVLPDELLEQARSRGLSDENLVDLTLAISTIFFTNITNHINNSVSSLPAAPSLRTNSQTPGINVPAENE